MVVILEIYENKKTRALIGCSPEELIKHIESKWTAGMSWDNYGRASINNNTWQIDHIKPCSKFNLLDEAEQMECFNYKNLQPMWAIDNIIKSDNYNE